MAFQSKALEKLLAFETACVESLPCTWKLGYSEFQQYHMFHWSRDENNASEIEPNSKYFKAVSESGEGQFEPNQLRNLLAYMNHTTDVTWESYSELIKPFYEAWCIPADPHYLHVIEQLTHDVLQHLKIKNSPQYAFIKKVTLAPNRRLMEVDGVELGLKLKELLSACPNLEVVDFLGASRSVSHDTYERLVDIFLDYSKGCPSIHDISLDLFLDDSRSSGNANLMGLTPTAFFEKYNDLASVTSALQHQNKIAFTIGRVGPSIPEINGLSLSHVANILPVGTSSIRFECMLENGPALVQAFERISNRNLKEVSFGIIPWMSNNSRYGQNSNTVLMRACAQAEGAAVNDINYQIHACFGAIDDKPMLDLEELMHHADVGLLCRTAMNTMHQSFGGIKWNLPRKLSGLDGTEDAILAHTVSSLSRIPPNYRVMFIIEHSENHLDLNSPLTLKALQSQLRDRKDVSFRLRDLAIGSVPTNFQNQSATAVGDRYPVRRRGSYEAFLDKTLPMLKAAHTLSFGFDRITMHRKRHSFGEVSEVLQRYLPGLCKEYNLHSLSLGFGEKAGHPGQITNAWMNGELAQSVLEEYMEPHIPHCNFLTNLDGLEVLEINQLEIITPNQYHWLLKELPRLLPATVKKLRIGDIRFLASCTEAPVDTTDKNFSANQVWLGAPGLHLQYAGSVNRNLEWKGEFVARMGAIIRESFGAPWDSANSGCRHELDVVFTNAMFWNMGPAIAYSPPFSRQWKSTITPQLSHVYRGSPLVVD
ncbi:hypothetical protein DFH27DRAFT_608119 [Peziza echinospora]|nr:hypothetical protein DFH27DRAFT_608119 [Peziza echinospora]